MKDQNEQSKTPFSQLTKEERRTRARKWLQSDAFLRAISVFFAVIVWLIVYTTIDTSTTRTVHDVPVVVDLHGTIAESNGLDVVDTETKYVDVRINGASYEIGKLTPDNFRATLSVTDVTEPGVYTDLSVDVERVDTNYDFRILSVSPNSLSMEFDKMSTKTFELGKAIPNIQAKDGYLIDTISVTPSTIAISGPDSIIAQIDHCVVENDESLVLDNSQTLSGELHIYDVDNKEIVSNYLKYEDAAYTISVPLYKKETLPLSFNFINVPNGIDPTKLDMTVEPASLTVAVPVSVSNAVKELIIGEIDFRKLDLNKSFTFEIPMLAGYRNLDNVTTATVTFDSEGYDKKYFSSSNLTLKNVPEGYSTSLLTTSVSDIQMVGKKEVLEDLTSADLVLIVDLSTINITVGEQRVPIMVQTTDNKQAWCIGEKNVFINITKDDPAAATP